LKKEPSHSVIGVVPYYEYSYLLQRYPEGILLYCRSLCWKPRAGAYYPPEITTSVIGYQRKRRATNIYTRFSVQSPETRPPHFTLKLLHHNPIGKTIRFHFITIFSNRTSSLYW